MKMWLNDRPPTLVGAVEPWQLESTARTSITARAAIGRRLVADARAGIGTFCQCARAAAIRFLIEMLPARPGAIRTAPPPGLSAAPRRSPGAPETPAGGVSAREREGRPAAGRVSSPRRAPRPRGRSPPPPAPGEPPAPPSGARDRKSTRLNSSHSQISYAVFCLKKKTLRRPLQHSLVAQR